ncbi:MAG: BamA/TamA family outer membrane protein, partial [Armatimonadetes bacterium]|nr:BamA/TamA family outer membrane protein [Armatimonadota bacterium]
GLTRTRPSLVRRQIRVKEGEIFNATRLRRDLNRLYDLGFFEDATFKVDDDPNLPGSLIVTYLLKEKRTGQLSFGVGFDSRSKLSGFATVQQSNLRGSGKRALASFETGSRRNFELSFGDPFVGRRNASYDISIYNRTLFREPSLVRQIGGGTTDNSILAFQEERTGGRINFTNPLDDDRTRILLAGYRNERARLFQRDAEGNLNTPVTENGSPLQSSGTVSALSLGFLRDKRDSRLDPSRGGREEFIVEQGLKLFGNTEFTKLSVDFRRYVPLLKGATPIAQPRLIFAGRAVIGRSINQLPAFEQYYIGGADTVRGYDTDEQFGDNQIYTNLELRYRLQNKVQLVGFVDAGTAFGGNFSSNANSDPLYSVGIGARLQTPIGLIRLDAGRGKEGIKTHFGIGSTF